ncbi:hypothetical protein [Methylopila turkensis]|uniref:Yip1 domain-containing protein n=1 Tax=Methylopila turkensis TaxID=1437816 RepID=A0A9W6N833_9HYPH|nr:hypothetical protein [Methylopila turkensis]GLK80996.1 hypothetical protein GCM10008174_27370 [Methylopila turkensis]
MDAKAAAPGYGWGALLRHVPLSVTRMRRVTREMQASGIDERWRFIAIASSAFMMAAESVALEAYQPDRLLDDWRAEYGEAATLAGYLVLGIVIVYALAALLHVTFRIARRGTTFADMRTAMAASGYPQIVLSFINLAIIGLAASAGEDWRAPALSAIEASLIVAMALAIGYGVVAVSAATGVPTLQILGLQLIASLGAVAAVAAGAWAVALVI